MSKKPSKEWGSFFPTAIDTPSSFSVFHVGPHPTPEPVAVPGVVLANTTLLPFPGWAEKWAPKQKFRNDQGDSSTCLSVSFIVFLSFL